MTDIEKQINGITKRINNNKNSQEKNPSEIIQCVVFYASPIIDNIDNPKLNIFNVTAKKILNEQLFVFPFYSKEVFVDQRSAELFMPYFMERLAKEEKIPSNVDELIKQNRIQTAVAPLTMTFVEKEHNDDLGPKLN